MPGMNFNAPQDLIDRFEAYVAEHKVENRSAFIRDALERAMDTTEQLVGRGSEPPAAAPVMQLTPHAAANVILSLLPEPQRNLIVDIAKDKGRPVLDFILSYCKLADERGETSTLIAEGAEDDAPPPVSIGYTQSPLGEYQPCAFDGCRKPFLATRRGQKFCPDPEDGTESCGRKAHLQELHAKRPQQRSRQHELAIQHGHGR